jgi:DNA-binding transcriptional ArsR family regulator
MRAIAHPVRLRILELLAQAPSTATRLANEIGDSTGSTSYHLRALAKAGLIEEDPDRGSGRERWWRRLPPMFLQIPTGAEDDEGRALETEMWGTMVDRDDEALRRFFERVPEMDAELRHASTIANWNAWLTPDEMIGLTERLADIVIRYRDEAARNRPSAQRVFVSFRILPWIE